MAIMTFYSQISWRVPGLCGSRLDRDFSRVFIVGVFCSLIFIAACGRRTPPRPVKPTPSFVGLEATQRGEHVRLSWVMQKVIPQETDLQIFLIEEMELNPQCIACQPELIKAQSLPFPSQHFVVERRHVYFHSSLKKGLKMHIFKVTHQNRDGIDLSATQAIQFTQFVDFPPLPKLEWSWLQTDSIPLLKDLSERLPTNLEEIQLLRFSWQPTKEKIEFYFPNQKSLAQRPVFYRVNLYQTLPEQPWPERPINANPIAENFYIEIQGKTKHEFLYQMRLVDSRGNESTPSITYSIPSSR